VLKFLEDPQKYLTHLPTAGNTHVQREKLETIKRILHSGTEANIQTCVNLARQKLEDLFHNQIAQLLHNFPVDYKNKEGTLFWSGPKRAPEVCVFNPDDEDHLNFIVATANLFAYQYDVPMVRDRDQIKELVRNSHVAPFAPRSAIIQTDEKQDVAAPMTDDDEEVLSALMSELRLVSKPQVTIKASEFEKDDDSNFHIDFIHAAANLRARNYRIQVADRQKSKMIAGKIIPAIATTTAMITGGVMVELYKRALEFDVDKFRNCFINLALPLFVFSEPMPPNRIKSKDYDPISMGPVKAYPEGFTTWDKLVVEGPCTLAQFMDQIKQKHHLKVTMVSAGRVCMFNGYLPGNKHADRLQEQVQGLYERIAETRIIAGRHYLAIEVSCETEAGEDVTCPTIKYAF
jgi:ubiquitin-activating enzyme E1